MPIGGVRAMLAGIVLSGVMCGLLTLVLALIDTGLARRRLRDDPTARPRATRWGWAIATGLFWWSVAAILLITLLPLDPDPGYIPPEGRRYSCSFDVGGPAPEGFWRIPGEQRTLNVLIFIPSGVLWVWSVWRYRIGRWVLVPLGLLGLVLGSVLIEFTQLALARLDRACDVTDMIDNSLGAAIGVGVGLVLALIGSGIGAGARRLAR